MFPGTGGLAGEVVQAELVEGCGVIGSPVAAGGVGAAVVPAEREARQWKRCLSGAGGSAVSGRRRLAASDQVAERLMCAPPGKP